MTRVIVVYDISDDNTRLRVARRLQLYGLSRIQRSAFAGNIERARVRDLSRRVESMIDEETDVVHIFNISPIEWEHAIVLGRPKWAMARAKSYEILY